MAVMITGRPLLAAGEVGAAPRPLAAFDPGLLGNDALTGLSLSLLCIAVLAVCGHRLWRELAVRVGWRPPGALVGVTVLTSVAIVASLTLVPTTPAFPRLEERRQAIQALGDELLGS